MLAFDKYLYLSIVLILSTYNALSIPTDKFESCQTKGYPKVVGSNTGVTNLRKIDVKISNEDVIVGGETSDLALHG